MKIRLCYCLFFFCGSLFAQAPELASIKIPDSLKVNANAVIRNCDIRIEISSRQSIQVSTKRIVTVLNEKGLSAMQAREYGKVQSISATIYDAFGTEIKKLRRKDFKDYSLSEGFEISDDRVLDLDYTPTSYPFTIVYESNVSGSNTALINKWAPVSNFLVSAEKSTITVTCPVDLGLRHKIVNQGNLNIVKHLSPGKIQLSAVGIRAFRSEQFAPGLLKVVPYAMFALDKFHLEGVDGEERSWAELGNWIHKNLLSGTDELSEQTKSKILSLTSSVNDPIEKARIIYKYVQDKTRYVSIQLGIGGWKPMKASSVDRLGYGDCKALTNYTRALLAVAGVESYYTVVHSDEKIDLDQEFVSIQGNHVILAIPVKDQLAWLECTNQNAPFGFQGNFTHDRIVMMITPEGGKLVRTNVYGIEQNLQNSTASYTIDGEGSIEGSIEINSYGLQYDHKYQLERESPANLKNFYKGYFSINNLELTKISNRNNRDDLVFTEKISIAARGYAATGNNRLIFPLNAFNKSTMVPLRYRDRTMPFVISEAYADFDEILFIIPEGYSIEAKPQDVALSDTFGEYKVEFIVKSEREIVVKRTLRIKDGQYASTEYDKYRKFREQIAKADNSKVVLLKI